ncbi:hypothetical protein CJU89_1154 [Yarrowia sp. B02]|nr:hypothetical protein CJU89_1154 [Yarrowia sp. B02]
MSYNTQALERGRAFFERMKHTMTVQTDNSDEEESAQLQDSLVKYYVTRNKPIPEWLEVAETQESLQRLKLENSSRPDYFSPTQPLRINSSTANVPDLTHRGRSPSPTSPQTPLTPSTPLTPTSPAYTNQRPPLKSSPSQLQDIYARRSSTVDVSRQGSITGFEKYGRPNYGYNESRNARVPPPLNQEATDRMREKLRNLSRSNSVRCN